MDDVALELALARRAAAGERAAAEELLGRVYDQVFAICRRICAGRADGEDATQEALISIARALPGFDGRSAVRTWVYRIATNAALDELRRSARRPEPVAPYAEGPTRRSEMTGLALDQEVVERLDVDEALRRLPADFRAAVVLRDLIGVDYAEIAEILELAPGTVRSRIARGRALLRESLDTGNQTALPDVEPSEP